MAHEHLRWHARSVGVKTWDADALTRKLQAIGAGLMLVDGKNVEITLQSKTRMVQGSRYAEVTAQLSESRRARV
jgi:hypothetical protein